MLDVGCRVLGVGCWMLDVGCRVLDVGCWMLDVGCWMLDVGYWMLGVGCWMLDVGCWVFGARYAFDTSTGSVTAGSGTVRRVLSHGCRDYYKNVFNTIYFHNLLKFYRWLNVVYLVVLINSL